MATLSGGRGEEWLPERELKEAVVCDPFRVVKNAIIIVLINF